MKKYDFSWANYDFSWKIIISKESYDVLRPNFYAKIKICYFFINKVV